MPKDNEVDDKAVAWMNPESRDVINAERKHAWLHYFGSPGEKQAAAYTEPLTYAATVAELRAEVERLRKSNELYSFAMNTAGIDELKRRADAAERRLSEVREIQRTHYGDGIGLHVAMILWTRDYDALTGADPT